jgi:hypothetical protein
MAPCLVVDLLVSDPNSGKRRGLVGTVRRTLRAMNKSDVPFCVIGATALATRGLPRMTRDLDLAVLIDDAPDAWAVLRSAGLRAATPTGSAEEPESMVVFVDPKSGVEVDLLAAAGDPEATVIDRASPVEVFGVEAPAATLEHLLLLYLYSNQPRHLGDFAAIVQSGKADLAEAERLLAEIHGEMLDEWQRRVEQARVLPAPPKRPAPRPRRKRK